MAKEPKKFGLIIPKSKQNLVVGSRLKPSFFDDDDELEHDKKEKKEKQSVGADKVKRHVQNQLQKALEEDPTAFQYDEVYDKIEDERTKVVETKKAKEKREPKYVTNLLKTAEKRQQEYEAREERKQMAEREKEAGEFDDREVFVTSTYRKKMEELQSYKDEERRKEQLESMMDVTKQKDMSGFYKHFLNDMTAGQSTTPEKTAPENKNDKEHTTEQVKPKKQKTFRPRERRSSSSSSDDDVDRQVHQKSAHKSTASTTKRRRSKSASSDEERKAFEEITSKHSRRKSSHSNAKVETEIQKKRRFFTPSPSPERTDGRRKSGEKSTRTAGDRHNDEKSRKNDTKSSRSNEKSSRKRSESDQKRKDAPKSPPVKKEKTPEIVPPVVEKKFVSEKEEKENKLKERLEKMKILFSRRNDDASINEYRRRYFERKEARKNA